MTTRAERINEQPTDLALHLVSNGGRDLTPPRDTLVEEWENAPALFFPYEGGPVYQPDGSLNYRYDSGTRLYIAGQEVMDSCETPWSIATVNAVFQYIDNDEYPTVFEAGAGQNITANRIMQQLEGRGRGEYHVVELNKTVYEKTLEWKESWERHFRDQRDWARGTEPNIRIYVYHGEAGEVTADLAEKRKRFKLIISDTYPLRPEEKGVNDLKHLDTFSRILMRDGVFAFYPYTPGNEVGSVGKMMGTQYEILNHYFSSIDQRDSSDPRLSPNMRSMFINPPPDYSYLQGENGPIRILPVVIASGLKAA